MQHKKIYKKQEMEKEEEEEEVFEVILKRPNVQIAPINRIGGAAGCSYVKCLSNVERLDGGGRSRLPASLCNVTPPFKKPSVGDERGSPRRLHLADQVFTPPRSSTAICLGRVTT